ncbi:uncharacterized protein [Haliotis asinina]|uniref:uncharacterized protein n=1 Tax=Haliotis asinina TaxID=109174 RepID=UPI003532045C
MDNRDMEMTYSLVLITLFLRYSSQAYVGCYEDLSNHRGFPHEKQSSTDMNVEMCIKACSGNRYAGVENGDECGASGDDDTKVTEDHCRMQCSGDHGQTCGDAWYISVYTTASDFSNAVTKGYISSASGLDKVSGLAASRAHPGYLYDINDNAGADKIYMVHDDTAKVAGVLTVQHSHEFDWEDIAVGDCPRGSGTCIFVADTGSQHHNQATGYAIMAPAATHTQNVQVEATYDYKWSSSEAMVVDSSGDVYMFSEKSGKPAHMAKLPSQNWNNGKINTIYSTLTLPFTSSNSGPLAADISASGTDLLIKTLNHIYYWSMPDKSVTNALQHSGIGVPSVNEHRIGINEPTPSDCNGNHCWGEGSSEALMVDKNGDVYILSEATGSGSKLAKLPSNGWGQSHPVTLSHLLTLPLHTSTLGPVAADISPNGQVMLIKTVNHMYHWHMFDGDVEKALQHPGEQVAYHTEDRGEAVAWNTDGNGYFNCQHLVFFDWTIEKAYHPRRQQHFEKHRLKCGDCGTNVPANKRCQKGKALMFTGDYTEHISSSHPVQLTLQHWEYYKNESACRKPAIYGSLALLLEKAIQGIAGTVKNVTKIRSGSLLIECVKREQAANLMETKSFANIPVKCYPHKSLNFSKGIIRDRDRSLADLSTDDIVSRMLLHEN